MADEKDKFDSPENPDNRIEMERIAADKGHEADVLAHPVGEEQGKALHEPVPRAVTRRAQARGKQPKVVPTTGHSWDGIEEYDNPMPRWWLWTLYATIVWGLWYTIAYPAWPMIREATSGYLGYSTRGEVAQEISAMETVNAALNSELAAADLNTLVGDSGSPLHSYAVNMGASVFRANCSQCHGAGAAGVQASGYPNLLDADWLWGGTVDDIAYTVAHGIRTEQSPDARWVEMPAYGGILDRGEIDALVQHVLNISGQAHDDALAGEGAALFADTCASCHGAEGEGTRSLGAPALNDAVWLYGGTPERISETIRNSRFGVMPAWALEYRGASGLDQAKINAVSLYVHQLGGGE